MFYLNMQQHLNRTGYLLCRNLVSVENATAEMTNHFPNDVEIPVEDFGSGNTAIFPSTPALNLISVDTTILKIVRKLLNTDKVLLTQSVPWAKYGRPAYTPASNRDQRIHMDYGNNQFTMPNEPPVTVAAMNHRYLWFDAKKYMKYEDPPPVPRFWHFVPLTLRSTASATDVREKLFLILSDLDVDVEVISSLWKYRFQKVCGSVYLDIQCHFFTQDSEIAVDINLLSGDRFVWRDLAQNIRVMFAGGNAKGECRKPRDFHLKPEQLFQLLEHGSLNDKRIAMRSLALSTCNVDIRKIEPWLQKPTGSFLEKEIRRWAEYIKVNRAHL